MNKHQAVFIAMSSELVGLIVGALYLGKYLDKEFEMKGLGVGGLCLGALFLWVYHLSILMKKYNDEEGE